MHVKFCFGTQHASAAPLDSNESPACFKLMLLEKNEEVATLSQEIECLQRELEELKKIQKDSSVRKDLLLRYITC